MPYESKAQSAAIHAAAEGRGTIGISQEGAKKFIAHSHGQNVKNLPEHVKKKAEGGAVSSKPFCTAPTKW